VKKVLITSAECLSDVLEAKTGHRRIGKRMNEISAALIHQFAARCAGPRRIALRERERREGKAGRRARIRAKPTGGREAISFASGSDV
jgi:hypothetical protein